MINSGEDFIKSFDYQKINDITFFADNRLPAHADHHAYELEHARHAFELPRVHYTVLRVAQQQLGIGGDDSWVAHTHDEYRLDVSGPKSFEFSFRGI